MAIKTPSKEATRPSVQSTHKAPKHRVSKNKHRVSSTPTHSDKHGYNKTKVTKDVISVPKWLVIGLLAIVLLVVGTKLLSLARGWQDNRSFKNVTENLTVLKDNIILAAGSPYSSTNEQACSRAHLKFARGPLVCHTSFELKYQPGSVEAANVLVDKINASLSGEYNIAPIGSTGKFNGIASRFNPGINYTIDLIEEYNCSINYTLIEVSIKPLLTMNLSCSKGAAKEIYPLK